MALTKCPECKKELSTLATTCPHCGAPVEQKPVEEKKNTKEKETTPVVETPATEPEATTSTSEQKNNKSIMIIGIIIIILLAALIYMKTQEVGLFSSDNTSSKEEKDDEPYEEKNPDDLNQIEVVKKSIIVREEADSESEKLGKIYEGDIYNIRDIVYIDETEEIAYEIEFDDESGYIITSRDEEEVEIILNNDEYEDVDDILNPELTKEEKDALIVESLLDNGFFESTETDNLYILGNTSDTTSTSIVTYNFDENTFNFYFQSGDSYIFMVYYFLEDKVEYMYMAESNSSAYMFYTYNTKTKTGKCEDKLNGQLCAELDIDEVILPLINQTISMFEKIIEDADLEITDLE